MKSDVLVILLAAGLCAPASAQSAAGLAPQTIGAVSGIVAERMARDGIPGLTVAIGVGQKVVWAHGFGLADVENQVEAEVATVYRLASISKSITAVAVMQLVERGKVDLDAEVQQYVPQFPRKRWPLRVRDLLCHQGGVRHYRGNEINSTRYYPRLGDGLAIFAGDELLFEPGTRYAYSTYGYTLLGCVVEGAAGMDFCTYLQKEIFTPAGMETIGVDAVAKIIPHRAQGYRRARRGGELRNSALADTSYKIPGGGLCSSAVDLVRFAIALRSGALVRGKTLERMWRPRATRAGQATGYGLGWRVNAGEEREVYHTGGQQRVSTVLFILPERGVCVAIMTNLERVPAIATFARRIARVVAAEKR